MMATGSVPGFRRDGKPLTHEAAQTAIEKICLARGHISESVKNELAGASSELRESHYSQAEGLRRTHAKFTKTVAEQIYSSKSRLIYELLQNTDDSVFAPGVDPSITFRITPSHLIVDSNETGFTLANVQAICNTGESSKAGESDTTGEKGFGFKSVFSISNRVHIQSGLWSFEFRHKNGDDGVGMVTPIWTNPDPTLSSSNGTRCKLEFSDKSNGFVAYLVKEFEKLPNILVFALRKLRKVTIILDGVQGRSDKIVFEKHGNFETGEVRITTIVHGRFGDHSNNESKFKVFQSMHQNMPSHELRQKTSSMITIAFEIDANGYPVTPVRGQYVFAYLPVQRLLQLPFLVQADFVLLASREAIPENDWNNALLQGVAKTFEKAVTLLRSNKKDPTSTRWMRYLPVVPIEGFWEPLFNKIGCLLKPLPILRNITGDFRKISDLRILPDWFLHDNEPLIPDIEGNVYLSRCYEPGDIKVLKKLDLEELQMTEILIRLRKCLSSQGINPIHSKQLDNDWHTAFTNLLLRLSNNSVTKKGVDELKIIPLSDGQWISPVVARDNPVYLPYLVDEDTVQIEVPRNLGLNRLHPTASAVGERREFYTMLGIGTCSPELVVQKIFKAHQGGHKGTVDDLRRDFEILFWFGRPSSGSKPCTEPHLLAQTEEQKVYSVRNIFLPSEDEHSAQQLLANTPVSDITLQGLGFLHPIYMNSTVRNTIRFQVDWPTWLQHRGMSYHPSLTTADDFAKCVSPAMKLVAKHNAEKFVPALKAHWSEYQRDAEAVAYEIGNLRVPCCDKISRTLKKTFVPTENVIAEAQKLGVKSLLPFLKLPESDSAENPGQWSFLEMFGVICNVNCSFYLAVLRLLRDVEVPSSMRATISSKLYAGMAESSKLGDAAMIMDIFKKESLIYAETASKKGWFKPAECVWDGPDFLSSVSVLSAMHDTNPAAVKFFKDFLSMRNANHLDIIKELEALSKLDNLDEHQVQRMPKVYAALAHSAIPGIAYKQTREMITNRKLIHVKGQWLKPSDCLWNCSINIAGRLPLDRIYPELRDFFVNKIGVALMNVSVLARELIKASDAKEPNADEMKSIFMALGQQLTADKSTSLTSEMVNTLIAANIIPVRGPTEQQIQKVSADFCINDHKRYGEAFGDQIVMVDFDHEEVTSLTHLFKLLNIDDRHLSRRVKANTIVECSVEDEDLTTHFQDRVHDLSCCAIHYKSPKYSNQKKTIHNLLANAKVSTCDKMWTELTVSQLEPVERPVKVKSDRAVVKFEEVNGALHIFVPSDKEGLYSCYCTELPSMLAEFLGIEDKSAEKIIYRLLNDPTTELAKIMKDEDIHDYSWIEKPASYRSVRLPLRPAVNGPEPIRNAGTITGNNQTTSEIAIITPASPQTQPLQTQALSRSLTYGNSGPVWETVSRKNQYKKLLQEIVRQARSVPTSGGASLSLTKPNGISEGMNHQPDYSSFRSVFGGIRPWIPEEGIPMGAAGELFVFERLRSLGVANFGLDNWQSNIRDHVNILPGYEGMLPWTGQEVSDIMYKGNCAVLREFLKQNTSHPYPQWLDSPNSSPVQYHLEIKTTPGPCENAFYMSQNQYRLMQDNANDPLLSRPPEHLYVIVRVFNLVTSKIGMEVYINPWTHLKDGLLEFVADPYKVIPKVLH